MVVDQEGIAMIDALKCLEPQLERMEGEFELMAGAGIICGIMPFYFWCFDIWDLLDAGGIAPHRVS